MIQFLFIEYIIYFNLFSNHLIKITTALLTVFPKMCELQEYPKVILYNNSIANDVYIVITSIIKCIVNLSNLLPR